MKNIFKLILALLATAVFCSCETYKVDDPDTTAVYPLDGRYICFSYDYNDYASKGKNAEKLDYLDVHISNTTKNENNVVWMYVMNFLNFYPYTECICFKANCDVAAKTFSASNATTVSAPAQIKNFVYGGIYYSHERKYGFTAQQVSADGSIVLNGYDTPTGYKADAISFTYTIGDKKLMVVGHRYTGWEGDYDEWNEFIENY